MYKRGELYAKETHTRSFAKALSYRAVAFLGIFVFGRWVGLSIRDALFLSFVDFVFKLALYYFNERVWSHISWGYEKPRVDVLEMIEEVIEDE